MSDCAAEIAQFLRSTPLLTFERTVRILATQWPGLTWADVQRACLVSEEVFAQEIAESEANMSAKRAAWLAKQSAGDTA